MKNFNIFVVRAFILSMFLAAASPFTAFASSCDLSKIDAITIYEIAKEPREVAIQKLEALCEQIRNLSKVAEAAHTDALTGLGNRRALDNHWSDSVERRKESSAQKSTYFAIVDIDHFKSVNDTYGHEVGDEVLAAIAQILKNETRDHDFVGRWGGEEFVLILEGFEDGSIRKFLERLKSKVESRKFVAKPLVSDAVEEFFRTISIGVSKSRDEHETLMDLRKRADDALYKAKKTRNTIHFSDCATVL